VLVGLQQEAIASGVDVGTAEEVHDETGEGETPPPPSGEEAGEAQPTA
jgi:hypothetical protein